MANLITIATFGKPVEAHLAQAKLASEGIEAFVQDDNLIQINWLYAQAVGGVKLQVDKTDVELALKILAETTQGFYFEENTEESAEKTIQAPTPSQDLCPRCSSSQIAYEQKTRTILSTFISLLFMIITPFYTKKLKCHVCGHQWRP